MPSAYVRLKTIGVQTSVGRKNSRFAFYYVRHRVLVGNFGLVEALVCWRLEDLFSICIIAFAESQLIGFLFNMLVLANMVPDCARLQVIDLV